MRCCDKCFWCRFSWQILNDPKAKTFKCKLYPYKRFNKPKIKGWFCKDFFKAKELNE